MIQLCLGDSSETEGTSPTVWLRFLFAVTNHIYFRWQIPLDWWSNCVWVIHQKLRVPVQQSGSVFSLQSLTIFISDGKYLWTDDPTVSGRFNRNWEYQSYRLALFSLGCHLPCLFQIPYTSGLMVPLCLGDSSETEGTSPTDWLCFLLAVTYFAAKQWNKSRDILQKVSDEWFTPYVTYLSGGKCFIDLTLCISETS